ncbi:hypothetical protein [Streptomyces vinaceus]|uniref:hypothetical protein n=1 Tax=Streptomyces vinaceus TaxID=1960 RepID=UPI0038214176
MPSWKFIWKETPTTPIVLEVALDGDQLITRSNVKSFEGGYAVLIDHPDGNIHLKTISAGTPGIGIGAVLLYCIADFAPSAVISTGTVALDARAFYKHMGFKISDAATEKASKMYDEYLAKTDGSCDYSREEYVEKMLNAADWFVEKDRLLQLSGESVAKKWQLVSQDQLDAMTETLNSHESSARSHYLSLKNNLAVGHSSERGLLLDDAAAVRHHVNMYRELLPILEILNHRQDEIETMNSSLRIFEKRAEMVISALSSGTY